MSAADLLESTARTLALAPDILDRIFESAPRDFPVVFTSRLPLRADLFGMAGITLFGRVYLLDSVRRYSPVDLIVLLRHEAEHVLQQRRQPLFYLRYGIDWLRSLFAEWRTTRRRTGSEPHARLRERFHRAYYGITAEREAYAAGLRARRLLGM